MLTKRQKQILDYINKYIKDNDYSPTLEEMAKHFRLSSVATVHEHLESLKSKGYLKKGVNQPRSVEIGPGENLMEIPLAGTIAAGQPIEAIEEKETITIARDNFGRKDNLYALKVIGNSMVNEGIFDGDTVIIKKLNTAENGQTVVAIIDNNEATLKKLYREKGQFRLQPANPSLFPIYTKELEIRGIVIKIIRNFEKEISQEAKKEKLERRNDYSWDFKGEKTKPYTHGFHTYPAMFIPQIARRLLLNYSKKGDTICDIFCGSGTALIESRLLGRNAYGIDLNPLATFLAKVKTTEINPKILSKEYFNLINRINKVKSGQIKKPNFYNIDFWFKKPVILSLSKIKKSILQIKDKKIRDFFLVPFSETVRLSSNMKNGEFKLVRYPKEKLDKFNPDVLGIFRKKTESNIKGMEEFYKDVDRKTWARVILSDSSKYNSIKDNSIDCIITSPPYGDSRTTVAYGQFSRLSAQWIDIFKNPDNASGVDKELLGGKATLDLEHSLKSEHLNEVLSKINKKDEKRAKDVLSFYIDLEKCLKKAYKILKYGKYFCLVVGNRTVKQFQLPTDIIIAELGKNIGFTCKDIIVRNIPSKRIPIKTSPTNIAGELEKTMVQESIIILRK